jgi:hypothetical protein
MVMKISLVLVLALVFMGCTDKYGDDSYEGNDCSYKSMTYKELRADYPKVKKPREIKVAGKIYNYKDGDIILVNEENLGIHVIDNSDKMHPKSLSFIDLPGNIDIAVKDGYLYADSFTDLVVIDIRDINNIKVVKRKEGAFAYDKYQALENRTLPYDCRHYYENYGKHIDFYYYIGVAR